MGLFHSFFFTAGSFEVSETVSLKYPYLIPKMGKFSLTHQEDFLPTHHPYSGFNSAACRASALLLCHCPTLEPRSLETSFPSSAGLYLASHFSMTASSLAALLHRALAKALSVPKTTISVTDNMMI